MQCISTPASSAYHAGKWGFEDSPRHSPGGRGFGIYPTIVEPGAIRTNFAANIQTTTPTPAYKHGAVAAFRQWITTRIADIGGANGSLVQLLLQADPTLRGLVPDRPEVIPRPPRKPRAMASTSDSTPSPALLGSVATGGRP